jgi:C4-dicarboxylate-specific signal transduction histidine kinase
MLFSSRGWRIRTRLLILFLIFGILPASVLGGFTLFVFRNVVSNQAASNLLGHTTATSGAVDQYLTDKREDIVAASQLPELATFLASPTNDAARQNTLRALKALANRPDYESVALVDPNGKIVLSSVDADINTDVSFRPYFIEPMKGTTALISDPSVSVVTNNPAIFFSAPIRDAGNKIIGVIRSRLSLNGIWGLVERDKDVAGRGSYGILVDENGIRIATSLSSGRRDQMEKSALLYTAIAPISQEIEKALVSEKRFGNATATKVQVLSIPEVANALRAPDNMTFESSSDNNTERNFAAVAGLNNKPWHYVILSPFSSFFSELDLWSIIYGTSIALLFLIIIITGFLVARGFTNPINQLTEVADRISLGELDAKIEVKRGDEIGELAEAIRRMQASLLAAIERLRSRRTGA